VHGPMILPTKADHGRGSGRIMTIPTAILSLPAFHLYENRIYRAPVRRFGAENTYGVSASRRLGGLGADSAAFLTPSYDITFSASAENLLRRRNGDRYHDFCMLPNTAERPVVFFGSKEYVPSSRR
jgi:hypothetical protein